MSIFKNGKEIVRAWLTDGTTDVEVDSITKALKVIASEHHEIHEEESYFASDHADIAAAASRYIVFVTPNTAARMHFLFMTEFEKESTVTITEGISADADGTAMVEFNRDRNSSNTADMVVTHTPTNPAGGTIIFTCRKGDGNKAGGDVRAENEVILKQNTKYMLTVTNHGATASLTNSRMNWYEE